MVSRFNNTLWTKTCLAAFFMENRVPGRKRCWKLIHYYEDGRNELYRPADDIGEEKDLAKSEPERTAALGKELEPQ